ncbi:MAG: bifunctional phosphoribosylaminoimidazolecarboxamide formyltransferase/IMP cyclohydrolase [Spirochaetaceae bacterium]|jgi:phosphoribosylaminoimidazolecarboxamide formyltransferase/IMP cyclohydrolase|nr:bifunctional phosphoribosylaminoimidazolecarboxamide formyltransferase/IMP cyclohydrolase [Spirochaetaceae bacterium]
MPAGKKKALISVYDKENIMEFARFLQGAGWEIISTGGTAAFLRGGGVEVTDAGELTGFPECLDGRVKTLHPAIHAGLLARRDSAAHLQTLDARGMPLIDLVCVNLYPFFEKARAAGPFAETLEFIDIGGPAMLRSAAKNFAGVLALTSPADYPRAMAEITSGQSDFAFRKYLAAKVFNLTAAYDAAVAHFLMAGGGTSAAEDADADFPPYWQAALKKKAVLRYGENAHQKAALYVYAGRGGVFVDAEVLGGKELGYNNIRDADIAWKAVCSFGLAGAGGCAPAGSGELARLLPGGWTEEPAACCVAVKHNTPCGIGLGGDAAAAFLKAKAGDPVSIFGGIVAFNCVVDVAAARALNELFLELVIAPDFEPAALALLREKPNLRVVRMTRAPEDRAECVSVDGGLLVQGSGGGRLFAAWELPTKIPPRAEDIPDLVFALRAARWVKSNAIVVARDGAVLGVGGGETSRIWAAELALARGRERAAALAALAGAGAAGVPPELCSGAPPAVLASDAFFPFDDVVNRAAEYGIRAIIQCGGSQNDRLSVEACDRHGIAMVFTGIRCFKH